MGPLNGLRILEFAGIGPGPFGGMMLADMGADVVRVDRAAERGPAWASTGDVDVMLRGRRSVALDLKDRRRASRPCCAWSTAPTR